MTRATIDQLIINSPYEEPKKHWKYDKENNKFILKDGRRSAGYVVATPNSQITHDPGIFVEIPLVNQIRSRVNAWRNEEYPGVTGVTRRLLDHWTDREENESTRFFFCQIEAIQTLIWLVEGPENSRVGVTIPPDGGPFRRLCSKMATGTGKTIVMAMVAAWQILNKVTYPKDTRFSKNILVVAPGLTVKNRLSVLKPSGPENYYKKFFIVPPAQFDKLRQGKVEVKNWHALNWESKEKIAKKRSVDKRGPKSDEAYVREVLGDMAQARNILVINDEAHHAWRVPAESKVKGITRNEIETATKWVGGLDRIQRSRGILSCYDFSATPFAPSGKQSSGEALFDWIVSDFGLNDAIESGLVKTPRVVVRDNMTPNPKTNESRFSQIYNDPEVKADLNRRAKPEEPLPDLVVKGYYFLGYDWRETMKEWENRNLSKGQDFSPRPVMITVANRTETAARVKYSFDHGRIKIDELCDPSRTLHIDSKVLKQAEEAEEPIAEVDGDSKINPEHKSTKKQQSEWLRQQVDTVGRKGCAGEKIQNVISVGMLSEGWDAQTVTHIMGLRAFSSQLLCEQVVGRGLRRTSYEVRQNGMFDPEYVNIFGIPFTFLPHETAQNGPTPPLPKQAINPIADKKEFAISWPNVVRINHGYTPRLILDWEKLEPLELDASQTAEMAELAPIIDSKPDLTKIEEIGLEKLARKFRTQQIIFETARDVYDQMQPDWKGQKLFLLAQLVRLIEQVVRSDHIKINPPLFNQDRLKRRLILTLNMQKLVQHIFLSIRFQNSETLEPVFDQDRPIVTTGDMHTWYTGKPIATATRSHINYCVCDSKWEASDAFVLDHAPEVTAWVKNDHLGFEIIYIHNYAFRKYRPDFLIRLKSDKMLILETKGLEREQDRVKWKFLDEWVRAVNAHGGFGQWDWAVSKQPGEIKDILKKHSQSNGAT
ncbi:MAG: DEAD/DEAH box helicase family protein [Rhodobacteraceae bacterium]|nr:DEAD/DEAH box helicase family protein [Paracoccaceae bacterium]